MSLKVVSLFFFPNTYIIKLELISWLKGVIHIYWFKNIHPFVLPHSRKHDIFQVFEQAPQLLIWKRGHNKCIIWRALQLVNLCGIVWVARKLIHLARQFNFLGMWMVGFPWAVNGKFSLLPLRTCSQVQVWRGGGVLHPLTKPSPLLRRYLFRNDGKCTC